MYYKKKKEIEKLQLETFNSSKQIKLLATVISASDWSYKNQNSSYRDKFPELPSRFHILHLSLKHQCLKALPLTKHFGFTSTQSLFKEWSILELLSLQVFRRQKTGKVHNPEHTSNSLLPEYGSYAGRVIGSCQKAIPLQLHSGNSRF